MNMDERILVVILSATLTVFLLLGIIVTVKFIQILDRIKKITEKAEDLAEKAEAVGDFFQKTAGPAVILKTVAKMAHLFKSNAERRR
jgi:alpha-D-ribose 1-methylphosphonate 5-phosphate C-P lyase